MKKPGDPKSLVPMSLSEIAGQLADDITRRDSRYDYFMNYEPAPIVMGPESFFTDPRKTKALMGANRSRKTSYGLIEAVMIFTGMIPYKLRGVYAHEKELLDIAPGGEHHRPRYVRIIVMDYSVHWPTVIRRMLLGDPDKGERGILPEMWSYWNEYEHSFVGPDGSVLNIYSADPAQNTDPRSLRGGSFDHTMIDEINQESVYTESLVRGSAAQDGPKTVSLTYCPQEGFDCWHYELLYKACYDPATKKRLPRENQNPAIFSQKISMRDNPSITEEEIEKIKNSMNDWEWAYRIDGEYSYRGENPYFRMDILVAWEREERYSPGAPYMVKEDLVNVDDGLFRAHLERMTERQVGINADFDEGKVPIWRIWELPQDGQRYILAADSSAGHIKSDFHVADVWKCTDQEKPKQAAQLRIRLIKPGEFAQQCACVATLYGKCLLVPEALGPGDAFIDRVRNYENLYRRITIGTVEEKEQVKFGWSTNLATKGPMLENVYKLLNSMAAMKENDKKDTGRNYCPINSRMTLMELQGFEERIRRRKDNTMIREWGGRAGTHDDCVMSLAIAWRIIEHEYDKISACTIKQDGEIIRVNEHKLRQNERKDHAAFSAMKKKPSLQQLRRRYTGR